MCRNRFSDEQIISIPKEHAAGLSTAELCRKHGISDATFDKWRSRSGGMEQSDAKRLRSLEEENARRKLITPRAAMSEITRICEVQKQRLCHR